jgi:plastocyanin
MTRRRRVLQAAGAALAVGLAGCGSNDGGDGEDGGDGDDPTATATPTDEGGGSGEEAVSLTINNVGVSAWEVAEDSSGSVAPTGEENATMTFQTGTRYEVTNDGWSSHPFALRASDDSPLLSQSADGSYEGDSEVNWADNETELAFTVTEELASELDHYICTIHSSMRGDVTTE